MTGTVETYRPRTWPSLRGLHGISDHTLEVHFGLYEGYVKNTNLLNEQISEMVDAGTVVVVDDVVVGVVVVDELFPNPANPPIRMTTIATTSAAATEPVTMPRRRLRWRARAADADVRCRVRCCRWRGTAPRA